MWNITKKSLIGTQNRLPGFASSLPGLGCHENRLVVVLSVIPGCCPWSYHRSHRRHWRGGGGCGGRWASGASRFLGWQHALGPFCIVESIFEIFIRCFEPQNLFFVVCIATDWRIAAHILHCRRMLTSTVAGCWQCSWNPAKRALERCHRWTDGNGTCSTIIGRSQFQVATKHEFDVNVSVVQKSFWSLSCPCRWRSGWIFRACHRKKLGIRCVIPIKMDESIHEGKNRRNFKSIFFRCFENILLTRISCNCTGKAHWHQILHQTFQGIEDANEEPSSLRVTE